MQAVFHHGSARMVDHTPAAAIAAGDIIVVGDELRIAHRDIPADELGALAIGNGMGVYRVPKATGASSGIGDGVKVYWDAGNEVFTTAAASGANKVLGRTAGATEDEDEFGYVIHDVTI